MKVQLSDHFNYKRLLRFVTPAIITMVFTSLYGVVDGLCVSNFVGDAAFASVNLIIPFPMLCGSIGFMLGSGGSALVAYKLGEGDKEKAKQLFSLMVYVSLGCGILVGALGVIFIKDIAVLAKADAATIDYCVQYGRILFISLPFFFLQNIFQTFFVTAEKPALGTFITVAAGATNIILDIIFIIVFKWGVVGAAVATAISQFVGGAIPFFYFARRNSSLLRLTKFKMDGKALLKSCTNGSSELMTNVSLSFVNILYNYRLIAIMGNNDGVTAYGVIMYVAFIFVSAFIGYSIGIAPIVGYNYGAKNTAELKNVFRKSLLIIGVTGIIMSAGALALALPLAKLFVGYRDELCELTRHAFLLYGMSFLLSGFNIFGSAFFTALGNGGLSALISFLRTLVFQVIAVLLVPMWLGLDGVWSAGIFAEAASLIVTAVCIILSRKKYGYM